MIISGSCHCRNITFELTWEPDPTEILARALAAIYAFGTHTADFHVCRRCGIVPLVTSLIGGRLYAVVNVNAFDGVPRHVIRAAPTTFGEESEELRLARRTKNWIADVRLHQ